MTRRIICYLLAFFLLADLSYTFFQNLAMPLDGDMAGCVIPQKGLEKIFQDPLGISVITEGAVYPNPNRFFAHWTFSNYFKYTPRMLQNIVDPVDSIYLACAIAKTIIQTLLIILLSLYITGAKKIFSYEFLIAGALITPLFQINGYRSYMGIVDPSITYTFFYALPCALLLLFYLPFFKASFYVANSNSNKFISFLLLLLALVLSLNGPLVPGIVLIISFLMIINYWKKANDSKNFIGRLSTTILEIPKNQALFFTVISLLCLYSLYIGTHNSFSIDEYIPLAERYARVPQGLYYLVTQKLGIPLLLLMIAINIFLISKYADNPEGRKILRLFKWIGLFTVLYIILLPLGGYKNYRPNILRYDTIMPITLGLIFMYGISACYLIRNVNGILKKSYLALAGIFSILFTIIDEPEFHKNICEKKALKTLAQSTEKTVLIESDCTVMAWEKIINPIESEPNARLLQYWDVTTEKKLYYQK